MVQLFRPEADTAFRLWVIAFVVVVIIALGAGYIHLRSDAFWRVGATAATQPIPFRHDLHVAGVGIACAFCHSTAERAAHAGMPTAHACLTCHSQILQGATVMEPLRTSAALGTPIAWTSVSRLPNFIYFHHGVHVRSGVGCETCHGRVDQMRETEKVHTMSMAWCLDCHRNPAQKTVRTKPEGPEVEGGRHSLKVSEVFAAPLTNCSVCHR